MKRICFLMAIIICISAVGCSNADNKLKNTEPQVSQMKSICELATMKCYYHNVAKYNEDDATGTWFWAKDRNFWVEYAGIVTIGIDTSKVKMEVKDDNVTITIPEAKVLNCKVDDATLTKDSFIVAKDSAKVEANHQIAAFKEAQAKMKESSSTDTALLANAQQRAQKLLEDYVKNIGTCVGKDYKIEWIYLENTSDVETSENIKNK